MNNPRFPNTQKTSGLAVTSLGLGILSFIVSILAGIPAIVLGLIALSKINRSNGQLTGNGFAIGGIVTGGITTLLIIPLVLLMLPAIDAARQATLRNVARNNLKEISLGLQNFHDTARPHAFPAAGGGEGKGSQLSWRVHILPFMEEADLYRQFHLDEPWDSDNNRKLISSMPQVFKDPSNKLADGKTSYLAVTGPNTAFGDGKTGATLGDFKDGMSNTVMIVEADADQAVTWTKPDDWHFDPKDPKHGLGGLRHGGFLAAFADAHTDFIGNDTNPEVIGAVMTRDGGEVIGPRETP